YTGDTVVHNGTLQLGKTGYNAMAGKLVVNASGAGSATVQWRSSDQLPDDPTAQAPGAGTVQVTGSASTVDLNNFNETISTLSMSGGLVKTGSGTLTVKSAINADFSSPSAEIQGNLALPSTAAVKVSNSLSGQTNTLNITAAVTG